MYRKLIGMLCIGSALLSSCESSDIGTTESGLGYEFVEKKGEPTLDSGMIANVNLTQLIINNGDTLMNNNPNRPVPVTIGNADVNLLMEGFQMLGQGDSAVFTGTVGQIFKTGVPPEIPQEATVYCEVRVVEVFKDAKAYRLVQEAKMEERNDEEDRIIAKYVEDNNLDAKFTDSGMGYVITEEGTGEQPSMGDVVQVHYTGTLLEDGTKFDSSLDRGVPFEFPVGQRRVIPGWDEALMMMKEGTKATLLIPSRLAYGPRQMGNDIKPNSILRFDVEFLGNKGPAQAQQPGAGK